MVEYTGILPFRVVNFELVTGAVRRELAMQAMATMQKHVNDTGFRFLFFRLSIEVRCGTAEGGGVGAVAVGE